MQDIIERYRKLLIQIASPYNMGGTGFFLGDAQLIITNEHLVRDHGEMMVEGEELPRQMARVVFWDAYYDLAFLRLEHQYDLAGASLLLEEEPLAGDQVVAMGHPFGLRFSSTAGVLSNNRRKQDDFFYYQHDAALNPGNSGGPLVNLAGQVIGVNAFDIQEGHDLGFSLPARFLKETLDAYLEQSEGETGARCFSCRSVVFERNHTSSYCPNCGAHLLLPTDAEEFEPVGTAYSIELLLESLGHDVKLSRRGLNTWEILEGSAHILVSYHEDSGLITGDAHLCQLPAEGATKLYDFLLQENYRDEGLTFSVKGRDIILSILIYDRYLNIETGQKRFRYLFERADYYDDILVDEFGAHWKNGEES